LLLAIGISFALQNSASVTLNYYFDSITAPLSIIVVLALALGCMIGVGASLMLVFAQRHKNSRLQRKLTTCEQEIRNLRQLPLRDSH